MTDWRELTLPFLERRDYLHGTTLFDALVSLPGNGIDRQASLSFKLSHRIDSDRVAVETLADARSLDRDRHAASLSFQTSERTSSVLGVIPLPPSGDPARESYDESLVSDLVSVEPGRVSLVGTTPFSLVATLIPLNKVMLREERIAPGRPGQWFFTRLDLDDLPEGDFLPVALELDAVLGGGALVRSRIAIGGKPIGAIFFSWV